MDPLDMMTPHEDHLIIKPLYDYPPVDHNYSLSLATVPMDISHEVEVDEDQDEIEDKSQEKVFLKFLTDPKSVCTRTHNDFQQDYNNRDDNNNNKTSSSSSNRVNNKNDKATTKEKVVCDVLSTSLKTKKEKKNRSVRKDKKKKKLRVKKEPRHHHASSTTGVKKKNKTKLESSDVVSKVIENVIDRTRKNGLPSRNYNASRSIRSAYTCAFRLLDNGRFLCLLCDKSYKNKNVLYNHRSTYHRENDQHKKMMIQTEK